MEPMATIPYSALPATLGPAPKLPCSYERVEPDTGASTCEAYLPATASPAAIQRCRDTYEALYDAVDVTLVTDVPPERLWLDPVTLTAQMTVRCFSEDTEAETCLAAMRGMLEDDLARGLPLVEALARFYDWFIPGLRHHPAEVTLAAEAWIREVACD